MINGVDRVRAWKVFLYIILLIIPCLFISDALIGGMGTDHSPEREYTLFMILWAGLSLAVMYRHANKAEGDFWVLFRLPESEDRWLILHSIPALGLYYASNRLFDFLLYFTSPELLQWRNDALYPPEEEVLSSGWQVVSELSNTTLIPLFFYTFMFGFVFERLSFKYSKKTAILVTTLLFGALSLGSLSEMLQTIILCLIFIRTRSVIIPVIYNLVMLLAGKLWMFLKGNEEWDRTSAYIFEDLPLIIIFGVIGVPWFIWFLNKNREVFEDFYESRQALRRKAESQSKEV